MVRRNLFQPPPPPAPAGETVAPSRFPNTGAMSGVKSTLRDMSSNAVREIDPALIEDSGPSDRLAFGPETVADLAESIRQHGQQVPIMVRPLHERPGRYQIVYGRRRLAALRHLGQPARAMVRSLDDRQAILAQGQENSLRLDPSFIEKALFVSMLSDGGHAQDVILDALAIDKPMLSRMQKVARVLPLGLVQAIGPAHGIGRRRWEELADALRDSEFDLSEMTDALLPQLEGLGSDERFARVATQITALKAAPRPVRGGGTQQVTLPDGRPLAELSVSARSLTVKLDSRANPEFTHWMQENAQEALLSLYRLWAKPQS